MNYSYIERCMSSAPSLCGVNGLKELLDSEVCRHQRNWKIHVGGWKGNILEGERWRAPSVGLPSST